MPISGLLAMEISPNQPSNSSPVADQKRFARSRVTNGKELLPGIDGRSAWVRRCRDVIELHLADLPGATAAEQSIVRRAAVLTTELERLEVKFAEAGEANPFDLDLYARTAGGLRRLLEAVGLERRLRDLSHPAPRSRAPFSPVRADLIDAETVP
jgi:hypothetical protein